MGQLFSRVFGRREESKNLLEVPDLVFIKICNFLSDEDLQHRFREVSSKTLQWIDAPERSLQLKSLVIREHCMIPDCDDARMHRNVNFSVVRYLDKDNILSSNSSVWTFPWNWRNFTVCASTVSPKIFLNTPERLLIVGDFLDLSEMAISENNLDWMEETLGLSTGNVRLIIDEIKLSLTATSLDNDRKKNRLTTFSDNLQVRRMTVLLDDFAMLRDIGTSGLWSIALLELVEFIAGENVITRPFAVPIQRPMEEYFTFALLRSMFSAKQALNVVLPRESFIIDSSTYSVERHLADDIEQLFEEMHSNHSHTFSMKIRLAHTGEGVVPWGRSHVHDSVLYEADWAPDEDNMGTMLTLSGTDQW